MPHRTLPPAYFEDMFAADPDPWRFETSAYEAAKYDATIAALGGRKYKSAIEVGCAIGVLTEKLCPHALDLLAIDVSVTALATAKARETGARFARRTFPRDAPEGEYDLVVLSEVLYYLDDEDLVAAGQWVDKALRRGGDLLLVHWTGATDYPQSGDEAVAKLDTAIRAPIGKLRSDRRDLYRLDLWRRL